MRFFLHEAAYAELDDAVAYYESCRPGLGVEFAQAVYEAIALARTYPEAGTPLSESTRRCLVKRFPFGVIYQRKGGTVFVVAVADLRRRPDYWRGRVSEGQES